MLKVSRQAVYYILLTCFQIMHLANARLKHQKNAEKKRADLARRIEASLQSRNRKREERKCRHESKWRCFSLFICDRVAAFYTRKMAAGEKRNVGKWEGGRVMRRNERQRSHARRCASLSPTAAVRRPPNSEARGRQRRALMHALGAPRSSGDGRDRKREAAATARSSEQLEIEVSGVCILSFVVLFVEFIDAIDLARHRRCSRDIWRIVKLESIRHIATFFYTLERNR